jgi:hypothetical protein
LNNSTGGNFTSLYYDDIDYPQYAYGYPQKSKGGQFCNDGYLFIINDDMTEIEVFIIHNGRNLISAYYQELIEGNFGHCIKAIRSKGKVFYDYWSSNSI